MLILNCLLIRSIIKSKRNIFKNPSLKRQYKFGKTIMAINICFIIFNMLYAIWSPISIFLMDFIIVTQINNKLFDLIAAFGAVIAINYESFSFFMNFLFNQLFREELYSLFKFRKINSVDILRNTDKTKTIITTV